MMSFNIVYKVIKSKCRTQDNTKIENMTRCNIARESKVEIYRLGKFPENISIAVYQSQIFYYMGNAP